MSTTDQLQFLPTAHIEPDPQQPRKEFDPEHIESLGNSILAEGLLQPVTVRLHPTKPDHYLIVTGECRWRAHCLKGIQSVKCIVTESLNDDARRGRLQLIENMRRKDMTLREESFGVERQAQLGDADEQIAASLGMTKSRVQTLRRMTGLSPSMWNLIDKGALAPATVEAAVGKIPFADVEGVLLRCAGKGLNQAAVILYDYQLQLRQDDFSLALEEAGVAQKQVGIAEGLAKQLMALAADIEALSVADRTDFARLVGNDVAGLVAASKRNKGAAAFFSVVFTRVNTVLEPPAA